MPHHAVLAFAHLVRKNAPSARRLGGLLALASSEEGATLVSTLKVLATIYFLPTGGNAPTTKPCVASGRYTPPPPSTSGSCRSARTRPAPTRGGRSGRRAAGTPSEATGKCTGELLVAHRGSSTPEVLHQTQLLECEVVAEPRKRVFEIPPGLLQKPSVGRCPACKVPQYLLAQRFTSSKLAP